jgi:hypothetical protein
MRAWIARRLICLGVLLQPPRDPRAGLRVLKTYSQGGLRLEVLAPSEEGGHLDSVARMVSSSEGESMEAGWVPREDCLAAASLLGQAARYMDRVHQSCEPIEPEG